MTSPALAPWAKAVLSDTLRIEGQPEVVRWFRPHIALVSFVHSFEGGPEHERLYVVRSACDLNTVEAERIPILSKHLSNEYFFTERLRHFPKLRPLIPRPVAFDQESMLLAQEYAGPDSLTSIGDQKGADRRASELGNRMALVVGETLNQGNRFNPEDRNPWTDALRRLRGRMAHLGSGSKADEMVPQAMKTTRWLEEAMEVIDWGELSGTSYSYSTQDLCPDNVIVTGDGVVFIDHAHGVFRPVAMELAALAIPFPTCWCCPGWLWERRQVMVNSFESELQNYDPAVVMEIRSDLPRAVALNAIRVSLPSSLRALSGDKPWCSMARLRVLLRSESHLIKARYPEIARSCREMSAKLASG
jgi:hypothetical protein